MQNLRTKTRTGLLNRSWSILLIVLTAMIAVLLAAVYPYFPVFISVLILALIAVYLIARYADQPDSLAVWFRKKNTSSAKGRFTVQKVSSPEQTDQAVDDTDTSGSRPAPHTVREDRRLVDDTQASVIFNRTADSIMELIHQTLNAYSAFFYLYNPGKNELVLQSFRSQSVHFILPERDLVRLDTGGETMRFFQRVIEHREPLYINLADPKEVLPYYSQAEPVKSVLLVPLLRRGVLLGIIGADHLEMGAFSDADIQLMHKYVGLIRHSIHTIDAVFVKNRLLRISNALKEYGNIVSSGRGLDDIYSQLKPVIQSVMGYDRYGLWLYRNRTLVLQDREGDFPFEPGSVSDLEGRIEKQVWQTQKPVWISDIRNYHPEVGETEISRSGYLDTVAGVPIADQGHCFGVMILEARDKYAFDQHQVQFLESLGQMAALAAARAHLDNHLAAEITYDPITGIDNRKTFLRKISEEIYRAKRFHTTFAVVVLKIAGWNRQRYPFGAREIRTVMESAAAVLKQALRQVDAAARLDEDVFGILLIESSYTQAAEIAARLVRQIEEKPFEINQLMINIKAHIGLAGYGVHGDTVESLMAVAEDMLRQGK